MSQTANPYAPPSADVAPVGADVTEAETMRNEHLKHEASVRSIGIVYYLFAFALAMGAVARVIASSAEGAEHRSLYLGFTVLYALLSIATGVTGRGLRKLKGWVKAPVGILSTIGLLGFPVGTLINGYILYLVFCRKGRTILTQQHRQVVEQTPHIKYRTPVVVWILLGLIVLAIAAALVASAF